MAHRRFIALIILPCCLATLVAGAADRADLKPPAPATLEQSINRGVAFLVQRQNKDGSWGSAHNTKDLNIMAPVPGAHQAFRAAVSAMAIEALIDTGAADKDAAAKAALDRGAAWLLVNLPQVRRADETALYNVWSHSYGIQALVKLHARATGDAARQAQIKAVIAGQIEMLGRYASVDGGWGYYDFRVGAQRPASDSLSFTTATGLIALHAAKQIDCDVPQELVDRAIAAIGRQRKPDHTYLYGEYLHLQPMRPINRAAGSLGRSQACNFALRVWGDKTITDDVVAECLDRLITRNDWLSFGRKRPVPHESWFQVAGYFYYYGHYYAALCVEQLEPQRARQYQGELAAILLPLQEKDGSWWDFPLYDYHQAYGTAFALMTLARCRPAPAVTR